MVTPERHAAAMDKVAGLVSVRERSSKEVAERLRRCGFDEEEAADAVETSVRIGLVDDRRFASAYIRGKTASGWGRAKIVSRLRRAGIGDELVEACSGEFATPEQELESARSQLARRTTRSKNPYASLMRRLLSRGFSYETASRAVSEHLGRGTRE